MKLKCIANEIKTYLGIKKYNLIVEKTYTVFYQGRTAKVGEYFLIYDETKKWVKYSKMGSVGDGYTFVDEMALFAPQTIHTGYAFTTTEEP